MHQAIAPIAVRPWTLNGLSERLLVSHYEHHYGSAVRALNAVRQELANLDVGGPIYRLGSPQARGAGRDGLRGASRAVLRQPGRGGEQDSGSRRRHPREALRECPGLAARVRPSGAVPRPWVGLGRPDLFPADEAALEPGRRRSLSGGGRRGPGSRARHVRARVPPGLRPERHGVHRRLHAQHRLGGGGRPHGRRAGRGAASHWKTPPMEACPRCPSRSSPPSWRRGTRSRCSMRGRATTSPGRWT